MAVQMVVLDLGNVLIDWDPALTQEGWATREEWECFVERTDFWAFNRTLDAGVPLDRAHAWFAEHHGEDIAFLDRYLSTFANSLRGTVPGMAEVVGEVRASGTRVGGLSNWPGELFHHARERIPLLGALEDVVVSGYEGVRKPDPRIYRLMLDRFSLDPSATVFVDDVEENVRAADELGIQGILFTGAEDLRGALTSRGVL
ncbi:HAD family hydrolase [Actinomyces polynesiensis]|uniref:HAD family hydrolase n=1 Tax=Actinomyces polynesiensis TaxID=1325934 RepID=UPI0005B7D90C|nr:HAD family phosphatase [Actinomyces polynesiensis]